MISMQLIRQDPQRVKERLAVKQYKEVQIIDEIVRIDRDKRALQQQTELLQAELNRSAKQAAADEAQKTAMRAARTRLKEELAQLKVLEERQEQLLLQVPNLPHERVPEGKSAEDNEIVESIGVLPSAAEKPHPHWDLARQYALIDFEAGNRMAGSGFPVYTGRGARLVRALTAYFLDRNTEAGYTEYLPPLVVNETTARGSGQLPDKEVQMYEVPKDGFYLIPTSEVPLMSMHRGALLQESQLPVKMTAYTPCFRREAGSYGREVRGLNRLHQFDKVEIVQITRPEDSYQCLEAMVAHVKGLLLSLELPFRIVRLCGGDMGVAAAMTYDFEVYAPAQQKWLEVSSVSNCEAYQTNRLKIRYKNKQGKVQLAHALNGSALAFPRIIAALLENGQTGHTIVFPKVLHSYLGRAAFSGQ